MCFNIQKRNQQQQPNRCRHSWPAAVRCVCWYDEVGTQGSKHTECVYPCSVNWLDGNQCSFWRIHVDCALCGADDTRRSFVCVCVWEICMIKQQRGKMYRNARAYTCTRALTHGRTFVWLKETKSWNDETKLAKQTKRIQCSVYRWLSIHIRSMWYLMILLLMLSHTFLHAFFLSFILSLVQMLSFRWMPLAHASRTQIHIINVCFSAWLHFTVKPNINYTIQILLVEYGVVVVYIHVDVDICIHISYTLHVFAIQPWPTLNTFYGEIKKKNKWRKTKKKQ